MSLIADALKAAQRDKEKHAGKPMAPIRRAQLGNVSLRNAPQGTASPWRIPLIAAGAIAGGVILFFVVLALLPERGARLPAPAAASDAPVSSDPGAGGLDSPSPVEEVDPLGIRPADGEPARARSDVGAEPDWLAAEGPARTTPAQQPRLPAGDGTTDATSPPAARDAQTDAPLPPSAPRESVAAAPGNALRITVQGSARNDAAAWFADAVAAHRAGDRTRAKTLYRRVIAADPTNAEAYNNLGTVHRIDQEFAEAEDAYRRALAIDPGFAAAWSNLGVVLEARGRSTDAAAAYQRALELDPTNAGTKVNLATQYYGAGLYPEARRLLDEAIASEPMLAEAHYTLGLVLEAQRDVPGAIRAFNLFLNTANGRLAELEAQVRRHLDELVRSG